VPNDNNDDHVPPFDCGDGYRQLEWQETIKHGDEFFGGTDSDRHWLPTTCIGDAYRPHTSSIRYAPHAIHRRRTIRKPRQ